MQPSYAPAAPAATTPAPDLLAAALEYGGRGWSVIPVIVKRASGLWKPFQEHPADAQTLRRLFSRPGITGLAVVCGSVSGGLAVRDFDKAEGYVNWALAHPDAAATLPTVQTARGFHVYGRLDNEVFHDFGDGELRADSRHIVLLPPSLHPSGARYTWQVPLPDGDLAALPSSLFPERAATQATQVTHCMSQQGAIPSAIAATLPTGPGQRNRKLFELARALKAIIPNATNAELKEIVREWFDLALPMIATKEFGASWADFIVAWKAVKHPLRGRWTEIAASAESTAVDVGDHDAAAAAIIRLCAALQAHHGARVAFPLSCELAGKEAGISKQRAWAVLGMLRIENVIELVMPGGKKGSKKAAEYRFLGVRS